MEHADDQPESAWLEEYEAPGPGRASGPRHYRNKHGHLVRVRETLERMADDFLREHGEKELVYESYDVERPEIIAPMLGRLEGTVTDLKNIYEPKGDDRWAHASSKGKGQCLGCGAPRFEQTPGLCRKCYSGKAKHSYQKKIRDRRQRAEEADERLASAGFFIAQCRGFEYSSRDAEHPESVPIQDDFSSDLIDEISELEQALRLTINKW